MRVCGVLAPLPPGHRWFELQCAEEDAATELHDLLVALAAIRQTGAEVSLEARCTSMLELLDAVAAHEPDVVLLAASSARWPGAVALALRLRRATRARVLLYGGHPRRFPEHALATAIGADQAVFAGVDALVEAVNRASLGQPPKGLAGVWDRSGPATPRPVHPGPLPTPAWSLLRGVRPLRGVTSALGLRMGPSPGPYGGSPESPAALARSLVRAARLRPLAGVRALDGSLASNPAWLDGLRERRERARLWPAWTCTLPPGDLVGSVPLRLAAAGCAGVTLDLGELGARPPDGFTAQVASAARTLRAAGLPVRCDLVIGAPGSSPVSDRAAWALAARISSRAGVSARLFRPEPGGTEWLAEGWNPTRWIEAQLNPARAVTWPRGYPSLAAVESEWRRCWLAGTVTAPWRVAAPLASALSRRPAAPARPGPR